MDDAAPDQKIPHKLLKEVGKIKLFVVTKFSHTFQDKQT